MNETHGSDSTARLLGWGAACGLLGALVLTAQPARAQSASAAASPQSSTLAEPTPAPAVMPSPTSGPTSPTPSSPPPTAATPAPAPPVPVAPPAAQSQPAQSPTPAVPPVYVATSPSEALVHVAVSYPRAWLETRSYVDGGDFVRTCLAPCDMKLLVEGREARVVAPGMTTSNVFRFDAGSGIAGVRVDGGSATARRAGIITLAVGIPVALVGMGLYATGRVKRSSGLEAAGIAGLAAGGITLAISLPLLLIGSTHVKNAKGSQIAVLGPWPSAL